MIRRPSLLQLALSLREVMSELKGLRMETPSGKPITKSISLKLW